MTKSEKLILKQNNIIISNQLLIMKALIPLQTDVDLQLKLMERVDKLKNVVDVTSKQLK